MGSRNAGVCGQGGLPPSTERQAGPQGQTRSLQCILPSTPESSPLSCPQDGSSFGLDVSRVGGTCPVLLVTIHRQERQEAGPGCLTDPSPPGQTALPPSSPVLGLKCPRADMMAPGAVGAFSGTFSPPSVGNQGSPIPTRACGGCFPETTESLSRVPALGSNRSSLRKSCLIGTSLTTASTQSRANRCHSALPATKDSAPWARETRSWTKLSANDAVWAVVGTEATDSQGISADVLRRTSSS